MLKICTIATTIILSTSSVFAGNLGISLDELLNNIEKSAKTDGGSLEIKKINCAENPMPGDASKKIVSCSHSLRGDKIFITNAELSGKLLDISTQSWSEADAGKMIGWIAAAVSKKDANSLNTDATKLVAEAKKSNVGSGEIGKGSFIAMLMGNAYLISVSAP